MKTMRKSPLAAAVSVAMLGGMIGVATPALGDGYMSSGLGQVLVFPYYTVRDGWQTLLNVTNTTDRALAVKIRFHEAQNSRDVLDFNVLMSPKDVWTAAVSANAEGGATVTTEDKTCTSPIIPKAGFAMNPVAYTGDFADGGPTGLARLTEGYVEMIVMGTCDMSDGTTEDPAATCSLRDVNIEVAGEQRGIGWATEHSYGDPDFVDGVPHDCKTADSYFVAGGSAWDGSSVPGSGNPIAAGEARVPSDPRGYQKNQADYEDGSYGSYYADLMPLKGNLTLVNIANGIAGGDVARAYEYVTNSNLVTAQQFPWFLEPTLATAESGTLWDARGLGSFEYYLNAVSVINEWSDNPVNGVKTDWVVNFPTKGFHVDQFCSQIQANNNRWRYNGVDVLECQPPPSALSPFTSINNYAVPDGNLQGDRIVYPTVFPFDKRWANGESQIGISYDLYDREERVARLETGTDPSPAPPPDFKSLPYETNVITLGAGTSALGSGIAQKVSPVEFGLTGAVYGWAQMEFLGEAKPILPDDTYMGLPVVGFMMKTRTFGNPGADYGQIMDHATQPYYVLDSVMGAEKQ